MRRMVAAFSSLLPPLIWSKDAEGNPALSGEVDHSRTRRQHLPSLCLSIQGQLVQPILPVSDNGVPDAQQPQNLGHLLPQLGMGDSDQLGLHSRWIGQRAKDVEYVSNADFPPHRAACRMDG